MSVFGLTQGWQRQPWAKTGERPRRYIPWAKTGERPRRYIRLGWNWRTPKALHTLGWNWRTPKALHTLGLERANAQGVRNSGLTRLHTNFPLHQLSVTPTFRYTNSKRSEYCGTSTVQPKRSFMWAAIAFAASGSPWVRKVRRGGAVCIP